MTRKYYGVILLVLLLPATGQSQNVSNYGSIPDPFLFLLREPAVHQDLKLTAEQMKQLREFNEQFDGELLSTRNMKPEQGQQILSRVLKLSHEAIDNIFTSEQQRRLQQIIYRLRGISFVLDDSASQKLRLTAVQRRRIDTIVSKAREEVNALQKRLNDGKTTQQAANATLKRMQTAEQREVLEVLTPQQQQSLKGLVGRQFDPAQLSHVSFKAPELADSDTWINSTALKLAQLKGKVVAVHFWAFQ